MSAEVQTIVALALVAAALAFLIVRAFTKRRSSDCGGCPPDKFKRRVKR